MSKKKNAKDAETKESRPSAIEIQYQISKRMEKVKHKICVISGKGGVGKTTIAVNLAYGLRKLGKNVGLCDVDITGPMVPKMLHLEDKHPLVDNTSEKIFPVEGPLGLKVLSMGFFLKNPDDAVIWRGPMKMSFTRQMLSDFEWGELDYLIFDLPPGTGDEILDILQLIPEVKIIIVSTPQDVSVIDARKTISMTRTMKRDFLGLIENMSGFICPHCGFETPLFGQGGARRAAGELGVPFLGGIPFELATREGGDTGTPVIDKETTEGSRIFSRIIAKIQDELEK